jgi:hypothetical protein
MNVLEPIERARLRYWPDESVPTDPASVLEELETAEPDVDILSDLEFGFLPEDWGDGSEPHLIDSPAHPETGERVQMASKAGIIPITASGIAEMHAALAVPSELRLATILPVVKLKRTMHIGQHGRDIKALQRILKAANVRKGETTSKFRKATRMQVITYQRRHGLHADGIVGPKTWGTMGRYMDGYTAWLVHHTVVRRPITDDIDHMVKVAWWYYAHRPLHYYQQRPMQYTAPPPNVDRYLDCSEYVYVCAKAGGLPDPSGFGYTGIGNTDTFLQHMRHTWTPKRGDLALYANPGHVTIVTGYSDAYGALMCLSNGSDAGPRYLPVHYRSPVAYLTWRT